MPICLLMPSFPLCMPLAAMTFVLVLLFKYGVSQESTSPLYELFTVVILAAVLNHVSV